MACFSSFLSFLSLKTVFVELRNSFVYLRKSLQCKWSFVSRVIISYVHPVFIHIIYFLSISLLGFLLLKSIHLKNQLIKKPRDIDFFFTSVSAATVSSMSTVEMEVFSNPQLVVLTLVMLLGGEVFTSTVGVLFKRNQLKRRMKALIEPYTTTTTTVNNQTDHYYSSSTLESGTSSYAYRTPSFLSKELRCNAMKQLSYVLIGYLLFIHVGGSISLLLYTRLVPSARDVLREKEISISTFSVFTTVSSFSGCGFIPTNENMIIFNKNTGLLLLLIPQTLLGNTIFPCCLRFIIWLLKGTTKRVEFDYLLESSERIGYYHLLPYLHCLLLPFTVLGLIFIQLILICSMEWHSEILGGFTSYQKLVAALFLSVNSRHTGESTVDLSQLSSAILVLFALMMYLPPYTAFLPIKNNRCSSSTANNDNKHKGLFKSLLMSQLSYLTIFVILICITERRKLLEDPLNFNVLNIVVEVISAYGNVGFSTGYSCERQLRPDANCKDAWYGFVGKWSTQGKLVLIFVMFFGRLKKFSMGGGKAWKLG